MEGFDLTAARLIRLRQNIDELLSNSPPELREDLFRLLSKMPREGLDAFSQFRDNLPYSHKVQGTDELAMSVDASGLEMEILPERHRATLWPYRPKREPDELLSSWLWRIARGLGAPPRRFLFDTVGAHIADVDKEIDDAAIERLAFFSGQSPEHLLHGTMRADVRANPDDKQEKVQRLLLRHGELVLNRKQGGRVAPVTQYCPVCLAHPRTAYLRRGWRFSIESVCFRDSCFLLDSCWKCGALLDPLSQTVPSDEFVCCRCYAQLAKAPSISMVEAVADQLWLYFELDYELPGAAESYIEILSSGELRGTNPTNPAHRLHALTIEASRLRVTRIAQARASQRRRKSRRKPLTSPRGAVS